MSSLLTCDISTVFFVQLMLLVDQINSLALTGAVFHNDGCVILTMTAVMALTSKDAPQVGTPGDKNTSGKFFSGVTQLLCIAFGNYFQLLLEKMQKM